LKLQSVRHSVPDGRQPGKAPGEQRDSRLHPKI
jgi:hypothetical protein